MLHRPVLTLAFLLVTAPLAANAQATASADSKAVQSGTYAIDPEHTQVSFRVSHMGFSQYNGVLAQASGELELAPQTMAATKVSVTLPAASIATTSDKLTSELRGANWLDAAKYPNVAFRSTKITQTGPDAADIEGDLTLHGVTKPIVLKARFVGAGVNPLSKAYNAGFEARATIKRTDFGVSRFAPLIGDEVELTIDAAFAKPTS